jgi:ACT domain-containing protein
MKPLDNNTAVITVIGHDTIGIIAKVSAVLADNQVNIKDITQTVLEEIFTMIMIVDMTHSQVDIKDIADKLEVLGNEIGLSIRIQHASLFNAMHRI